MDYNFTKKQKQTGTLNGKLNIETFAKFFLSPLGISNITKLKFTDQFIKPVSDPAWLLSDFICYILLTGTSILYKYT